MARGLPLIFSLVAVAPGKGGKTELTRNHNSTLAPSRRLAVDEVIELGSNLTGQMEVVEEDI